jgi:hypothetical protein
VSAPIHDAHLLQHLLDDHADVLVVDLHALQAVHLLHFVEQVLLHRTRALDAQNVVRVHRPFGQTVTGAHAVALVHTQVLAGRHFVQLLRLRIVHAPHRAFDARGAHEDLALAALDVAEADEAVHLGNRRRILRLAGFEELGHTRQTAGDVARLVRLTADLGERHAGAHLLAVLDREHGTDRHHEVAHALLLAALLLPDLDVRMQLLLAILDHDALTQTGELVELFGHRLVFHEVHEADLAFDVGDDGVRVRVPREHHVFLLDRCPSSTCRMAPSGTAGALRRPRSCRWPT